MRLPHNWNLSVKVAPIPENAAASETRAKWTFSAILLIYKKMIPGEKAIALSLGKLINRAI
jgi:hypothetical protein